MWNWSWRLFSWSFVRRRCLLFCVLKVSVLGNMMLHCVSMIRLDTFPVVMLATVFFFLSLVLWFPLWICSAHVSNNNRRRPQSAEMKRSLFIRPRNRITRCWCVILDISFNCQTNRRGSGPLWVIAKKNPPPNQLASTSRWRGTLAFSRGCQENNEALAARRQLLSIGPRLTLDWATRGAIHHCETTVDRRKSGCHDMGPSRLCCLLLVNPWWR